MDLLHGRLARGLVAAVAMLAIGALLAPGLAAAHVPTAHLEGSRAVAPHRAPAEVKAMIAAGNKIRHKPYRWGGGHRDWRSRGYDCSGAVSYVLHGAGLLDYPLDSTGFMHWGRSGGSRWVDIYANHDHVFMVVAGLRWDTSYITDGDRTGPGWSETMRPTRGFRTRHPIDVGGW